MNACNSRPSGEPHPPKPGGHRPSPLRGRARRPARRGLRRPDQPPGAARPLRPPRSARSQQKSALGVRLSRPQPLQPHHDLSGFRSGNRCVDSWIRRRAHSNAENRLNRIFVVIDEDTQQVAGIYALTFKQLARDALGSVRSRGIQSATTGKTGKRRTLYVDVEGFASHLRNK